MNIIDSHCHLDDPRFDGNREQILNRALAQGIQSIVIPGVSAETWSRSRAVAEAHRGVYWTAGLHPYFLHQHQAQHLDQLLTEIEQHHPLALGECGLDFYDRKLDPRQQDFYFSEQLQIARQTGLPVVVHARKAVDEVILMLREVPGVRAQIHSFSGSQQQAYRLIDAGHMLSIGANVLYDRAQRLQRTVSEMPLESLLVETDAPDQAGPNHRGELNEPAFLTATVEKIAQLRDVSAEQIADQTRRNAETFFGIRFDVLTRISH